MKTKTHDPGRKILILLMTAVLLLGFCPGHAEEEASPYRIVLTVPGGWTNNRAVVRVSVEDRSGSGWQSIEYRMNSKEWIDCEKLFEHNSAEIDVYENGTFTLRITDSNGHRFEETAQVNTVDLAAPSLAVTVRGQFLHIDTWDDLSGIAGVQVNSMLFTTVTGRSLDVELDSDMNRFEKLAVRAFDFAGNFTDPVTLENPYYEKPPDPTPLPTPTAKPTKVPSSVIGTEQPPTTTAPTPAPSPMIPDHSAVTGQPRRNEGGSVIYVYDDDIPVYRTTPTSVPTPVPTAVPTPEPIVQTEYVVVGPGMPFKADGNSHTLDVLYSAATNKQFITVQSRNGNTFYLVIDYDKPIDEEAEIYETYFLNPVDERDLLSLMSDEEKEAVPTPTPEIIYVTPVPTAVPLPTPVPAEPEKSNKPDQMTAILALAGILAAVGIGAFALFRNKGKNNTRRMDNDFDMDDSDEESEEETREE